LSKSASTHQKHPPAKVAIAGFAASFCCALALTATASTTHNDAPAPARRIKLRIRILPPFA
jgi:hypothetical protein